MVSLTKEKGIALEETEVSRLTFLTQAFHHLRSPLTAITGYAELLRDPTLRPPDADPAQYGGIIARQASRVAQIVEQTLTVASLEADQLELDVRPVRLGPLLAEVVAEARRQSSREICLEDGLGATRVAADALRLRQVVVGLLDNALKFSPAREPVELTLRPAARAGWAEISVVDHGIGIADADRPILFTRFGRIYKQETRALAGSGLSLYIAKQLIDRQGGQVTVRSQPGRGSAFRVLLPLA